MSLERFWVSPHSIFPPSDQAIRLSSSSDESIHHSNISPSLSSSRCRDFALPLSPISSSHQIDGSI
ncbi:hypothetical protein PVAP13_9KG341524 [Panicum virgatum]|uniref:Uncharacterized protein n=1 Tax=Panicum virgatum TaxID=38727 RepID=A0A8T0NR34_PANVG|nr:hypothetical protein PVAP13_9KG341524 [Panicum virgatum]